MNAITPAAAPVIGEPYEDGIYAGFTIHDNAAHHLILLPGDVAKTWPEAIDWAARQGGELPSRVDLLILFKNLRAAFKRDWYWSAEQFAGADAYAWSQGFGGGDQNTSHEDDKLRARAVRRSKL